ncbi:MAG: hypothetical protein WCY11_07910 [Novosphingobium sp.]
MADEEIITTRSADGQTSHTTVVTGREHRSSGGGWLIALVLIALIAIGIYIFAQQSESEVIKDNAISEAARDVGTAAENVGQAAQDAAKNLDNK